MKKDEIQTKNVGLREKEESLKESIERAEARLKDLPSEKEIAEKSKRLKMKMGLKTAQNKSWYRHKNHLEGMTFEDKRDMLGIDFRWKGRARKTL